MAPEVITNGTHIRISSDMFSFGVVLWEILSGQIPWQCSTSVHIAYQVVCNAARPPLPDAHELSAPAGYVDLMRECWTHTPEDRPTCAIVVLRLRRMLHDVELKKEQKLEGMYM
jgi:serine/threonine protein kinase